jgi:hypothetical protein
MQPVARDCLPLLPARDTAPQLHNSRMLSLEGHRWYRRTLAPEHRDTLKKHTQMGLQFAPWSQTQSKTNGALSISASTMLGQSKGFAGRTAIEEENRSTMCRAPTLVCIVRCFPVALPRRWSAIRCVRPGSLRPVGCATRTGEHLGDEPSAGEGKQQ